MSLLGKLILFGKPFVLIALVLFGLPGGGSRPAAPSADIDTIKAKKHKLFTEVIYAEALG